MTSSYGEIVERLEKATQALIDAAERQARFWRDHQRRVRDRDEKTRFAVRAEPWENKALAARMALEALRQPVAFDYDAIPVPSDIAEFGARHNIEQFGNATYRNGFMEGQRALFRALTVNENG